MDIESSTDACEAIFTALAHPARRRILISLNFANGEMSAGQIAGLFAHAWPTTTRHLQQLEAAGIVHARAASLGCLSPGSVHGTPGGEPIVRPCGESSFYAADPWDNPLCFVDEGTIYQG